MSKERDDALEEAARLTEEWKVDVKQFVLAGPRAWPREQHGIAAAIRSLKGPSPSPETKPCPSTHGFSTDPIGQHATCVLKDGHTGRHWDGQGRCWSSFSQNRASERSGGSETPKRERD